MSLEKHIDDLIRKAIEEGDFDDLEGQGKPLNLDDYFNTPEDIRAGHALLKSSNFVPEEVEMMREIGELRERIAAVSDNEEKEKLNKKLQEKMLALSLVLERNRRRR
jgi:hypothetical protein